MPKTDKLKIAIVHDWFVGGGAERVVLELHKMFPEAPIYTSYCTEEWRARLDGKIVTGWLQHWPFSRLRKFLPALRIWWFTHLDFSDYDLVISSSGAEAKGIKTGPETIHVNYCHAPTHYYWSRYDEYLANPGFGRLDPLARWGLKLLVGPLRRWDHRAAQRPDYMIANSNYIKGQIEKYYGRESVVIYPPVDVERFEAQLDHQRLGFVTAGRQTPYKRTDLAVKAANELKLPLVVIGRGPEYKKLKKLAGRTVNFFRHISDEELPERFAQAQAFIFPGVDDFGIVAIEALATGTPVIAYKAGGALDYITPKTGMFFTEQTVESLEKAIKSFKPTDFNHQEIKDYAKQFSAKQFHGSFMTFIRELKIQ